MKRTSLLACLGLALALTGTSAIASDDSCVSLSDQHRTSRFGTQYLLVKDGDEHFKVSFAGNQCGMLAVTPKFRIKTGGEANRLCSSGSTVSARTGSCKVNKVEAIDAEEFARLRRKG